MSLSVACTDANRVVGGNIRRRREAIRLGVTELAATAKLTIERLQNLEAGLERLHVAELIDICAALNCNPEALLPTMEKQDGEYTPRWIADARALNALHPRLFDTLKRLPENRLRLMLISMQAMCLDAPVALTDRSGAEKASA